MVKKKNQKQVIGSAVQSVAKFAKFVKLTGENTEELIRLTTIMKNIYNKSANSINIAVKNFRVIHQEIPTPSIKRLKDLKEGLL